MSVAKVDLVCKVCGNKFTHRHDVFKSRDVDAYIAWARENVDTCPDCRKAQSRAAAADKAARHAAENDLPALVGSEKQVAWAMQIRYGVLNSVSNHGITVSLIREWIETGTVDTAIEEFVSISTLLRKSVRAMSETSAKWWIEHQ